MLATALLCAGAGLHPSDGPDADVRVRVDPDAVRVSITVNLSFLDAAVDAPHEQPDSIHPVEEPAVRDAMFEFFAAENAVAIDGLEVSPLDAGFEVAEPELDLLPLFPLEGLRALSRVRIDLEYPAKSHPETLELTWGAYPVDTLVQAGLPEDYDGEPPTVIVNAVLTAGGLDTVIEFTEDEPRFVWRDSGVRLIDLFESVPAPPTAARVEVPLVSAAMGGSFALFLVGAVATGLVRKRPRAVLGSTLLAAAGVAGSWSLARVEVDSPFGGAPELGEDQALAVFRPLHANIYRAFDYADEGDVYDALARSVDGALLDELYDEIYRSLVLQEEGGAVSRVQAVRPIDTEVLSIGRAEETGAARFEVEARWQVDGMVHHWGHTHSRTNEHLARYAVAATDAGWRIAESHALEQFRVGARALGPTLGPRGDL